MKQLNPDQAGDVGGGLDPCDYETQLAPEPAPAEPLPVIDYNPPVQPQ